MPRKRYRDVIHRWENNPVITPEDIPFPCNTVFNAAAAKTDAGEYILLLRVEDLQGKSVFALACSEDGLHFTVADEPIMTPATEGEFAIYERKGIEDPRISRLDGEYYVIYTAASRYGPRLALARTEDFRSFERVALISEPDNKDGVLFPRKISGRYARLDRPMFGHTGNIWVSYSPDLIHWGESRICMPIRDELWDSWRVGASAQPIETEYGWLEIYHGVKQTAGGPIYRLGAALLDLEKPSRVLCRTAIPILTPREYYERVGDVNNVVFSCGAVMEDEEIRIYYGAADTAICVGMARLDELLRFCTIGEDEH